MKTKEKELGVTNILIIVMTLVFIAMSAVMIFLDGIKVVYLCYSMCVAGIVTGIIMIVRYFVTDAYRNVKAYGFSLGTLLVILSLCGILKANQMAEAFLIILGMILLLAGIFVLQHSLDLRRLNDILWIPALIVASLILICSVVVILQPMEDRFRYDVYVWWVFLFSAALSLLINIYTMIKVSLYKRKEEKIDDTEKVEESADNNVEGNDDNGNI